MGTHGYLKATGVSLVLRRMFSCRGPEEGEGVVEGDLPPGRKYSQVKRCEALNVVWVRIGREKIQGPGGEFFSVGPKGCRSMGTHGYWIEPGVCVVLRRMV